MTRRTSSDVRINVTRRAMKLRVRVRMVMCWVLITSPAKKVSTSFFYLDCGLPLGIQHFVLSPRGLIGHVLLFKLVNKSMFLFV